MGERVQLQGIMDLFNVANRYSLRKFVIAITSPCWNISIPANLDYCPCDSFWTVTVLFPYGTKGGSHTWSFHK